MFHVKQGPAPQDGAPAPPTLWPGAGGRNPGSARGPAAGGFPAAGGSAGPIDALEREGCRASRRPAVEGAGSFRGFPSPTAVVGAAGAQSRLTPGATSGQQRRPCFT